MKELLVSVLVLSLGWAALLACGDDKTTIIGGGSGELGNSDQFPGASASAGPGQPQDGAAYRRPQDDDAFRQQFKTSTPPEQIVAASERELAKAQSVVIVFTRKGSDFFLVSGGAPRELKFDLQSRQQIVNSSEPEGDAVMEETWDNLNGRRMTRIQVGRTLVTKDEPVSSTGEVTRQMPFGQRRTGTLFTYPSAASQADEWKGAAVAFETHAGVPAIKLSLTKPPAPLAGPTVMGSVASTQWIDGRSGLPLAATRVTTFTSPAGAQLTDSIAWSGWNTVPPIALPPQ